MLKKLKVIEVTSDNCGQCQIVEKYLTVLLNENWDYESINYSNAKDIIQKYQILTVPTTIFLVNNKEKDRFVGMKTRKDVMNIIRNCENVLEFQKFNL